MKQKVIDFIKKVRELQSLEGVLELLRYDAEQKNYDQTTKNITQTIAAIQAANKNLIGALYFHLFSSTEEFLELQFSYPSLLESNILDALQSIKNTEDHTIPNKSELLALITSFSEIFSERNMLNMFEILEENESELYDQIVLLEDLCVQE